ncbi:MAG: aspartate ammonia-lyase [Ignavibacteria bacterium]|jgi:aspartate ammonia-lyase
MRIEKDSRGEVNIPDKAFYGIHSFRSANNFPHSGEKINPYLIKAYLQVKKAAAETNNKVNLLFKDKYEPIIDAIDILLDEVESAIADKDNSIYEKIIVDPYQGGAGTSLNMNINEVIANLALKQIAKNFGDYDIIHPIDHVNMSQSTNDTFPTAFKIASIYLLKELQESFAALQREFQNKEEEFKGIIKLGRTQLQDAVPITLGQEFGAFAQAFARDRWRLYNAEERLRSVNLGGTAIGNSVSATTGYVLNVNSVLKKITGLPIAKSEDLIDATQNLDMFVEVHGIVKAGAVSIIKVCNDLRLLASGPKGGFGEIILPAMQSGSSIMPGKINPVVLENAIQFAEMVKGNDVVIGNLAGAGNLELNAFIPLLSHLFLKSLQTLKDVNYSLAQNCIAGIKADAEKCKEHLIDSSAIAASLISTFGYDAIQEIVKYSYENELPFVHALLKSNIVDEKELFEILSRELGIEIE